MIKIGITGSNGLIGYHLRVLLNTINDIEYKLADRATFQSEDTLIAFAKNLDVIVHLADTNIFSKSVDISKENMMISEKITKAAKSSSKNPHIIFASSIHTVLNPNIPYSKSKIECANYLKNWCINNNSNFTNLIIPHVFGEFGKPFYNSVVSTFCHQLANGDKTKLMNDSQLELIHAHDVSIEIYKVIKNNFFNNVTLTGAKISVSDLRKKLIELSRDYFKNIIPDLTDDLNCKLFNTLRSYLKDDFYPRNYILNIDNRGFLYELINTKQRGLSFLSNTKSGITRGNHFHIKKIERFMVIRGEAIIKLRKLFTNDILSFEVNGDNPTYIDIPTCTTHNITNIGRNELTTLFWSNSFYDENNSDTYFEEV
jgi:UDP-2-acetamido-2,6-beta-L-arabino-hexul-4-ose reductase